MLNLFLTHVWRDDAVWAQLILDDTERVVVPDSVTVRARVETPDGSRRELTGRRNPDIGSEWLLELPSLDGHLDYLVDLEVTGRRTDGRPYRFNPPVFTIAHPFPVPELIAPDLLPRPTEGEIAEGTLRLPDLEEAAAAQAQVLDAAQPLVAPPVPEVVDVAAVLERDEPALPPQLWAGVALLLAAALVALRELLRRDPLLDGAQTRAEELAIALDDLKARLGGAPGRPLTA